MANSFRFEKALKSKIPAVKMAQKPAIIIDNGSYTTKAGFAGDEGPKTEFVTIVGRPRHQNVPNLDPHKRYIGDELEAMRAVLMLKYPVERGIIDKWDEIEKVMPVKCWDPR